jgi:hypothetical protein
VREECACHEHEFDFQYTDVDIVCPKCGRKYVIFMDMNDEDDFYYELIPLKEEAFV